VLAARETIRFRQQSIVGLKRLYDVTAAKHKLTDVTSADLAQVDSLRSSAEIGLAEDLEALRRARWVLASLLSMPPAEADRLTLRGSIRNSGIEPPDENTLLRAAFENRPDLAAQRLGIVRAQADVELAKRNRFQDVYMLYQPYTFQNGQPFGTKSSTSWALGMTVPLPLYNRNQGNILRNELNVTQTQTELAALERQVVTEVVTAAREYAISRATVQNIEKRILPIAQKRRDDTLQLYQGGETDVVAYLMAQRDYNEYVRQYREAIVRHRRSMLNLNTAVGQRIMP
jgi:outer membrane protein, heavy metal efflux system